jgi:hypothetical protein
MFTQHCQMGSYQSHIILRGVARLYLEYPITAKFLVSKISRESQKSNVHGHFMFAGFLDSEKPKHLFLLCYCLKFNNIINIPFIIKKHLSLFEIR